MFDTQSFKVRFEMVDPDGSYRRADYSSIQINKTSNYNLTLGTHSTDDNWKLVDSMLELHNGQEFSTKDYDNDKSVGTDCSSVAGGPGWWDTLKHKSWCFLNV